MLRCGDEYCQILLTADVDDAALIKELSGLKTALERQYGAPKETQSAVPQDCPQTLATCLDEQRAYVQYVWQFPEGETIKLRLGKKPAYGSPRTGADHKLRLLYTRPNPATKVATDPEEAPDGLAGFGLSMTPEAARTACEGAGNSWTETEEVGRCDAPLEPLGVEGEVEVEMLRCGEGYCQIMLTANPQDGAIVNEVIRLKAAMERRFGAPRVSNSVIPTDCKEGLAECVDSQRAYLEYIWTFPGGERLQLRLGKKAKAGAEALGTDHKVHLLYTRSSAASPATEDEGAPRAL
jgi:hypothetical protein